MHTQRFPATPVMIIFIIYDPACLNLSASQKFSVNHLGGVKKPQNIHSEDRDISLLSNRVSEWSLEINTEFLFFFS